MDTNFFIGWGIVGLIGLFFVITGFLWVKDNREDWPIFRRFFKKTAY